ncbi:hypothetical protein [Limnohabitans sp.]|uniref:hypothetical protein n=1 Tax=Limnohabitans sp. TaxID=1907725 RepID=UPI0025BBA71B|nr:hypothetical protein [Limnohabitans sp.]
MARAAQSLEALWRSQAPAVVVEHFTGDQRLALLSHINQGIAELGLTQAMQAPSSPGLPRQIAIVTHAEHLPASDVQMLQDLTRHLPGLCWRWVLLCLEQPGGQNSAALASMNPAQPHSQWTAEPAPVAPVAPVATVAPAEPIEPFFEPVEPFFPPAEPAAPTEPVVPAAAVEPVVLAKPAETVALAEDPILAAPTAMPQAPTSPSGPTNPSLVQPPKRLAWLGWAAVLVLAAWGTWLHFGAPKSAPSLAAERPVPAAVPATEAASAPDASPAAPQASALEAPPVPSTSAPQPTDPTAANTAPSQAAERVASTATAEPAALPPTSVPADNTAELPDVALRGVRWLAQQSPEFFVLEHGTFQTATQAQSLIRTRAELANARVLMRKSAATGGRFLVITGPFRSQERAQNYKVRENLPPQIQVRRVSEVLQESVRAAPARP